MFNEQDLDNIIVYTRALSRNHPDLIERAKARLAVAYVEMMDATTPGWRSVIAKMIEEKRSYEGLPQNAALDVQFRDLSLVLGNLLIRNDHIEENGNGKH